MSEKKIDPKNPNTASKVEADNGPAEESRTSQRVASRRVARKVSRTVNKRII